MTTDIDLSTPPPDYDSPSVSQATRDKDSTTSEVSGAYIYYRVYTRDGAIPSKSAFDSTNPYVGRIPAKSVPPPHNAMSLKRCVASAERFSDPPGTSSKRSRTLLFQNQAAQFPMEPTQRVAVLGGGDDPGKSPETAFALKVVNFLTTEETAAVASLDISDARVTSGYLYYQLYNQTGQDTSKLRFDQEDPSVGRLERFRVSPPLCPQSIKRCIAKVEGNFFYANAELYLDISAEEALYDSASCEGIQNETAGSVRERPVVLVRAEPETQKLLSRKKMTLIL
ncbi:hypothetical protein DFH06DRAFT_1042474 [Mycena polygramma]|nr:hypothetical protein DFH06DRAFT_1042474 [Mycena polygramma]